MRIAVAGGTGAVGTHVVEVAQQSGHEVLILASSHGVDLRTGEGLDLSEVDAVIDASGPRSRGDAVSFFTEVTTTLLDAEAAAGVGHHIALSIVGAAANPYGYYEGKAAQERLVESAKVPWTILRTTQFFEFAEHNAIALGPFALVAKMESQPLAAASVARKLVEIAESGPANGVLELAGPERLHMGDLARMVFETHGEQRTVIEFPVPGKFGSALRNGGILPGPNVEIDSVSYEDWLVDGAH